MRRHREQQKFEAMLHGGDPDKGGDLPQTGAELEAYYEAKFGSQTKPK